MSPTADLVASGVDCHAHLEGSLDPAWVRARAGMLGRAVPPSLEAFWRGETLPFEAFIEPFYFLSSFITGSEAAERAILALVAQLPPPEARLGGCHPRGIDLWMSPHYLVQERRQLSLDCLLAGVESGIAKARAQGVHVAVVIDAVNHLGPAHGHEVLDLVLGNRPEWIVGFSTGGLEHVPFRDWAPVFDRARSAGLRLAAHAGENGPGENVREAVLHAGVERIIHGVRAAADPSLLAFLAERDIFVNVCVKSNTCLIPDLGSHPLAGMVRAGVPCALGTDDPGIMPSTLASEFRLARALGLSDGELDRLRDTARTRAWCLSVPA